MSRSLPALVQAKSGIRELLLTELENEQKIEGEREAFIGSEYWFMLEESERATVKRNFRHERKQANNRIANLLQSYHPSYVKSSNSVAGVDHVGTFGLQAMVAQSLHESPLAKRNSVRIKRQNNNSPSKYAKDGVLTYLKFESNPEDDEAIYGTPVHSNPQHDDYVNEDVGEWTMDAAAQPPPCSDFEAEVHLPTPALEPTDPSLLRGYDFLQNEHCVVQSFGTPNIGRTPDAPSNASYRQPERRKKGRRRRGRKHSKERGNNSGRYPRIEDPTRNRKLKRRGRRQNSFSTQAMVPSPVKISSRLYPGHKKKKKRHYEPADEFFSDHPFTKKASMGQRLTRFQYKEAKEWNFPPGYKQPWKKKATKENPYPKPEPVTGHDFDYYGVKNHGGINAPVFTLKPKKKSVLPLEHLGNEIEGRNILDRLQGEQLVEHIGDLPEEDPYDISAGVLSKADENKKRIRELREQLRLAKEELETINREEQGLIDQYGGADAGKESGNGL